MGCTRATLLKDGWGHERLAMRVTRASATTAIAGRGRWLLIVALSSVVGLASTRYFAGGAMMIPPPLKPNFLSHSAAFYVHIAAASTALLLGPWQFLGALRRSHIAIHRITGMAYALACLIGGLAALPIAEGSNGGPVAAAGFLTLALLWLCSTGRAVLAIVTGDIPAHRRWMIRSFALTLAGVTLRLYLPLALFGPLAFSVAYACIAWLCWLPNLILAERFAKA
jgi:uncharacterized membrane protein